MCVYISMSFSLYIYDVGVCISSQSKFLRKSKPGRFRATNHQENDHSNPFTCFRWSVSRCVNARNGCRKGEVKLHENNTRNPRNCSIILLLLVTGYIVLGMEVV